MYATKYVTNANFPSVFNGFFSPALVGQSAERYLPAALAVHDTRFAADCGFRQRDILPSGDVDDIGVGEFGHKISPFVKI